MKTTSLFLALVACLALTTGANAQEKTTNILFIGNSYTFYNSLDKVVQEMLNVSGVPTSATRSTPGGWRLRQHFNGETPKNWKGGTTPEAIKSKAWDYVVLQEQSTGVVDARAEYLEYGQKVCGLIRENNPSTKILLYQTWGRSEGMFDGYGEDEARKAEILADWEKRFGKPSKETVEALKDGMKGGCDALAKAADATVAPVGEAFQRAGDKIDLHADEGNKRPHHPSPQGTYLAGCVFFKTISGKSPIGLYEKLKAAGQDFKVSAEEAAYLEKIADETAR